MNSLEQVVNFCKLSQNYKRRNVKLEYNNFKKLYPKNEITFDDFKKQFQIKYDVKRRGRANRNTRINNGDVFEFDTLLQEYSKKCIELGKIFPIRKFSRENGNIFFDTLSEFYLYCFNINNRDIDKSYDYLVTNFKYYQNIKYLKESLLNNHKIGRDELKMLGRGNKVYITSESGTTEIKLNNANTDAIKTTGLVQGDLFSSGKKLVEIANHPKTKKVDSTTIGYVHTDMSELHGKIGNGGSITVNNGGILTTDANLDKDGNYKSIVQKFGKNGASTITVTNPNDNTYQTYPLPEKPIQSESTKTYDKKEVDALIKNEEIKCKLRIIENLLKDITESLSTSA